MRLRGEVEDGVDFVALQAVDNLGRVRNVALVEGEIALLIESPRVVERGAVIELVERHDVVGIGIGNGEVPNEPTSTALFLLMPISQCAQIAGHS